MEAQLTPGPTTQVEIKFDGKITTASISTIKVARTVDRVMKTIGLAFNDIRNLGQSGGAMNPENAKRLSLDVSGIFGVGLPLGMGGIITASTGNSDVLDTLNPYDFSAMAKGLGAIFNFREPLKILSRWGDEFTSFAI